MIIFPFQFGGFGFMSFRGGAGIQTDPNYNSVGLLLHCNGVTGNTLILDSSISPKTITSNGNASLSSTQSSFGGYSVYFDGNGDYLSVPYHSDIDIVTSDFTIEFWAYPSTIKSTGTRLFSTGGGAAAWNSTNGIHILLQVQTVAGGSKLECQLSNNTGSPIVFVSTGLVVTANNMQHICLCKQGNTLYLGLNGIVESSSIASTARPSTNPSLNIATLVGEAGATTYAFQGYMDDIRVTKGIARYTANYTVPEKTFYDENIPIDTDFSSVSLLMHFDKDNTSTSFVDYSPNKKTVSVFGNSQHSTTQSKFGGASALFDGTGDYLTVPNHTDFNIGSADFTLELFVYLSALPSAYKRIFSFCKPTISAISDEGLIIEISNTNKLTAAVAGVDNNYYFITSPTDITTGGWLHIALVRSGSTLTLYRDGVSDGSVAISVAAAWSTSHVVYISRWPTSSARDFSGYIDELRLTKGIARYTSAFTPPAVPFYDAEHIDNYTTDNVLHLHMSGANNSTTFTDSSPVGNVPTVFGNTKISTSQSRFGGASAYFDGSGDYLSYAASNSLSMGTGDFTVEMYAYLAATPSGCALISEEYITNAVQFTIGFCDGTTIGSTTGARPFFGTFNGSVWAGIVAPSTLTLNTWYHLAGVRSGNNWTFFIDGLAIGTFTSSVSLGIENPIFIGRRWDIQAGTYFNGYIDEVRITKGVARYLANFPRPLQPF